MNGNRSPKSGQLLSFGNPPFLRQNQLARLDNTKSTIHKVEEGKMVTPVLEQASMQVIKHGSLTQKKERIVC